MTHDELLAKINYNLDNEVWLYDLGEAVRTVVKLHSPNTAAEGNVCFCGGTYPCLTIQAIQSALD